METIVSSNDFLQLKSSSLGYGKSLLPHWVNSLECYYFYYARALCKLMGASPMMVFGSSPVINFWIPQSVTCLATDACLTADPGVASSIPVRSHTFVEIDHEMISMVILLLPLIHSRRVVVSYKRKYVHELLVNRLFKPAQEKVWLGEVYSIQHQFLCNPFFI